MNLAQRILRSAAATAVRLIPSEESPPPPKAKNLVKSSGSPFGTHERFGVLNRGTRRMAKSKRFAKKLKAGRA